ncbi:MAG: hypothetical protein EOO61_02405 [Hymenobacter sp.]|nr:MAG: hypothetical protein EOO61_02405 [Hymenobacter sp.]
MKKAANTCFYDSNYPVYEQMPRIFYVDFKENCASNKHSVAVSIDGKQIGDVLTDNAHREDGYRYHDVFHLSYLAVLGWSACMRKILGKKRKSCAAMDEVEDGARATSVEEGVTSVIFNYAEQHNFFEGYNAIDPVFLQFVKLAFSKLEVQNKSCEEWQQAILTGYNVFRQLKANAGGRVEVNLHEQRLCYVTKCAYA